jgi:hypothetical protein
MVSIRAAGTIGMLFAHIVIIAAKPYSKRTQIRPQAMDQYPLRHNRETIQEELIPGIIIRP